MENLCGHYDKALGCLVTFDGSCCKEECFTYRLIQKLEYKEQECNKLYIQLKADEEYHKEEENTLRKIIKDGEQ